MQIGSKVLPTDKCNQTKVNSDGSLLNYCDAHITGFANFKKRRELSIEAGTLKIGSPRGAVSKTPCDDYTQSHSPLRSVAGRVPTSTYFGQNNKHVYLPRQDKYDGYYQCPRPMVLPYNNNIDYGRPYAAS